MHMTEISARPRRLEAPPASPRTPRAQTARLRQWPRRSTTQRRRTESNDGYSRYRRRAQAAADGRLCVRYGERRVSVAWCTLARRSCLRFTAMREKPERKKGPGAEGAKCEPERGRGPARAALRDCAAGSAALCFLKRDLSRVSPFPPFPSSFFLHYSSTSKSPPGPPPYAF